MSLPGRARSRLIKTRYNLINYTLRVKSVADLEEGAPSSPPKTYIPEGQSCYRSGCDASMAGEETCIMHAVLCCGALLLLALVLHI